MQIRTSIPDLHCKSEIEALSDEIFCVYLHKTTSMKARYIFKNIEKAKGGKYGRILVLTGARQTGKTTLAKEGFPGYVYLSIEDPVMRRQYVSLTASQWKSLYPEAILDEIQKEPQLIESIKAVYDQWQEPRYILTGSSQLLLMDKVRESLAGRCLIFEIYPLTVPEIETGSWTDDVKSSASQDMLLTSQVLELFPSFMLDPRYAAKMAAWNHYACFGGYPALTDEDMTDDERYLWLAAYVRTYLERDVRDLASFRDLEPYVKLQKLLALQTGGLFNSAALATHAGVSAKTVRRYLQYLEMSYQTITLQAWEKNVSRRFVKSPKIHYLDYGVLQAVVGKHGTPTGEEFESMVIAELYKQARQTGINTKFYHLRMSSGSEVDCLIEIEKGYYAFEIKQAEHVQDSDARHLKNLSAILDKPLLHGFVLSNDVQTRTIAPDITAVHVAQMLG